MHRHIEAGCAIMTDNPNSAPARRDRFTRLCLDGLAREDIAEAMHVSAKHVRKYARELGLPIPPFRDAIVKPSPACSKSAASIVARSQLWNEERIAALRALWGVNSLKCEDIAERINAEFGANFTRNAIIGKAGRLGLSMRTGGRRAPRKTAPEGTQTSSEARREFAKAVDAKRQAEAEAARREAAAEAEYKAAEAASIAAARKLREADARAAFAAKTASAPKPVAAPRPIAPAKTEPQTKVPVGGITIHELTACTCRWPLGETREFASRFCGAIPMKGRPYCRAHCSIGFQLVPRRRVAVSPVVPRAAS
jgi:GcrA cell cycle regulator